MKRPEQELQKAMHAYLTIAAPSGLIWTFVNNGMKRSKAEGGIAKAMGQRAGWPDFTGCWQGHMWCVEVKAGRGSLSQNQHDCHHDLRNAGASVFVCKSLDDLYKSLLSIGVPLRAHPCGG